MPRGEARRAPGLANQSTSDKAESLMKPSRGSGVDGGDLGKPLGERGFRTVRRDTEEACAPPTGCGPVGLARADRPAFACIGCVRAARSVHTAATETVGALLLARSLRRSPSIRTWRRARLLESGTKESSDNPGLRSERLRELGHRWFSHYIPALHANCGRVPQVNLAYAIISRISRRHQ